MAEVRIQPMGTHGGSAFTVRCELDGPGSVHLLRQAICAADGTPPELQRLIFSSRPLPHGPRGKSLRELGISDGDSLFIMREAAVRCQLVIKSPTGDVFTHVVAAPGIETVGSVREAVLKEWGAEMGALKLAVQGSEEPLEDEITVSGVGLARGGGLVLIEEGAAIPEANVADLTPSAPPAAFSEVMQDELMDLLEDEAMSDYQEYLMRAAIRTIIAASTTPLDDYPPEVPSVAKRLLVQRATERHKGCCVPVLLPDEMPLYSVRMVGDLVRLLKEEHFTDYAGYLSDDGIRSMYALQMIEPQYFPESLPNPARKLLIARGQGECRKEPAGDLQDGYVSEDLYRILIVEYLTDYASGLSRCGIRTLDGLGFAEMHELPDEMPAAAQQALMAHRPERKH